MNNGDPHGDDQFISIAGTSWATAALALALPDSTAARYDDAATSKSDTASQGVNGKGGRETDAEPEAWPDNR